ncbi:MAG: glycosyltransferase [Tannerella sp.]|jgi:glycosyltransferase involved in cell wall biosynthesis|nr:glycosyltransferase [Tannerella sp.]
MQEFINKKILLVNKFYYNRGGDCVAMLNTEQLLKAKGHEVAVFSMKYARNIPSEWEDYFPDEVNFSARDLSGIIKAASRLFSPKDVAIQFKSLLNVFRPDIVHLHNIHSYLSPIVASIAHQKGIRVVWTMHDYKLICPAYSCLNNGLVCERCFKNKHRVFIHKCMKNSYPASLLGWMEAVYWNKKKLIKFTHRFISPSRFLKTKMIEAGFPDNMIEVLPNFIPSKKIPSSTKKDYYCYVGRISGEKGIDTLLNAASQLPYPLKIIGDGPLLNTFRRVFNHENIDFMGYLPQDRVYEITKEARCVVMPSVWYENNPLSAIEALSIGTPVLGSRIGGIPELIDEGFNGFLCTPKNTSELQEKIELCFNHFHKQYNFAKIAEQAQNKFDSESFYKKLLNIYDC